MVEELTWYTGVETKKAPVTESLPYLSALSEVDDQSDPTA